MKSIPAIKLLHGTHPDTGSTGQGCFMNVIAYLNGEPQITDNSDCVCVVVRSIAIWLNDYCDNTQRQRLLPFILRAIGSRTDDKEEMSRRVKLMVKFAETKKNLAAQAAKAAAMKEKILDAGFEFLDAALPKLTDVNDEIISRACELKRISETV